MTKTIIIAMLAAAIGAGAYFVVTQKPENYRPDFAMKDIKGELHHIDEWNGKVIVLNFWATWCPPCVREIPAFIELQEKYQEQGVVFIGVALDTQEAAEQFIEPMDINYPVLIGEQEGIEVTTAYGNRNGQLPYTVFINRDGVMVDYIAGEVTHEAAEKRIQSMLNEK